MGRISHIEIHAENTERAVDFYREVFDWTIIPKSSGGEEYWLVLKMGQGSEISGGIRPRLKAASNVPQYVVDSVDDASRKVQSAGGQIIMPKKALPGTGYLVYCQDTEGNLFALLEKNFTAK